MMDEPRMATDGIPLHPMCRCTVLAAEPRRSFGDKRSVDRHETRLLLARIYGCPYRIVDDVVAFLLRQIP